MRELLLSWIYKIYRLRWRVTRPITVGVRILLVQDGQVLLVRHTYQPGWYLPGGGVKRGETTEQAARREAAEETGAILGELRLHGIFAIFDSGKSDHALVFTCEQFQRTADKDWEISEARFFDLHALPPDIADGNQRRVEEYLRGPGPYFGRW